MDTNGGGIGKAAEELMQEMQKAQQELQKTEKTPGGPNEAFQAHLREGQAIEPSAEVKALGPTTHINAAQSTLLQARAEQLSADARVGAAAKAERSQMATLLEQLVGGQDKMSSIMKLALSGRHFSSQELLAMQAGVYRFSQELDLTGKVIEKATSGIKQTMNTQV